MLKVNVNVIMYGVADRMCSAAMMHVVADMMCDAVNMKHGVHDGRVGYGG